MSKETYVLPKETLKRSRCEAKETYGLQLQSIYRSLLLVSFYCARASLTSETRERSKKRPAKETYIKQKKP